MSKTVAIVVTLAVAIMTSASRPAAQAPSAQDGQIRRWLDAVAQHRPGQADASAALAASWTGADLERLLPALVHYLDTVRGRETWGQSRVSCDSCQQSRDERDRLLSETRSRVGKADRTLVLNLARPQRLNDLIQRAVILHADAVMRVPKNAARPVRNTSTTNVLRAPRQVLTTDDGKYLGAAADSPHWFMARALLEYVTPEPALDAQTRRWYLAAGAYMAAASDFAQLWPHLQKISALYPRDAEVAFDLGWQAEVNSTPRVQAHLRALIDVAAQRRKGGMGGPLCASMPCDASGTPYGIKSERESLSDAERHYARAVALDPLLTEAHVRLAHTRTRLGRHADADAVLRNLPPAADDPFVTFYAAVVHGMTLEGLGRLDDAADAYQRALVLSPHAPSVNLALSALEQRRGDATLSVAYARRAVEPQGNDVVVGDPFAFYHLGPGRKVGQAWAAYYAGLVRAQ